MNTWEKELERALRKKFYEDEVKDILAYYREIIEDRKSNGESMDAILNDYVISDIVKAMMPEILMKRKNDSYLKISKSTKQLLILLLSSPLLIPLGIVYISILIFIFSMMVVSGMLMIGSLTTFVGFLLDMISSTLDIQTVIGLSGFALMMFSMLMLISIWLFKGMMVVANQLFKWFTKIANKRGENI